MRVSGLRPAGPTTCACPVDPGMPLTWGCSLGDRPSPRARGPAIDAPRSVPVPGRVSPDTDVPLRLAGPLGQVGIDMPGDGVHLLVRIAVVAAPPAKVGGDAVPAEVLDDLGVVVDD